MNFSEFLKEARKKNNFHTAKDLFEHYGGERDLEISFRQFQNIEAGKTPPSPEFVARIFEQESIDAHHTIIQAFFNSHLEGQKHGASLLKYVTKYLGRAVEEGKFSWDKTTHRHYTESQIDYLSENSEAFTLQRRVLLEERAPRKSVHVSEKVLKKMIDLELIEIDSKWIKPGVIRYRLPKYGTASPRMVAKAHEFIFKHVERFISKEGSEKQEIAFAFQLVEPGIAKAAREQLRLLKEWVQSHVCVSTPEEDPNLVPLAFVGFCKELTLHELRDS